MKYFLHKIALFSILLLGCTEIDVGPEELPDVSALRPDSMETGLPVFDIKADPDSLSKMLELHQAKIVLNAAISLYNSNGALENLPATIEVKGKSSARYVMKSIGAHFKQPVNNSQWNLLQAPILLPGHSLDVLPAFRLRNSGNDFGETMIKDLAYTEMAIQNQLNFELMYGRPAHAFLNGEYYGLFNLRNESTVAGIAGLLQKDTSEVTLVEMDEGDFELEAGNADRFESLEQAIKNEDAEKLKELIDIESFIDYIIFEDYIGNTDWPHSNCRTYCIGNGKFRFFLFDLDYAAFQTKNALIPELEYREDDISAIYQILVMNNPRLTDQLVERQKELYKGFSPAAFNQIVDRLAENIEDEIPYLIARHQKPESVFYWHLQLDALKREFERRDFYIRKKYDLQ